MRRAVGAGSFPYLYPSSSTLGFRLTGSAVPAGLEGFLDGKPTFEKVGYYRSSLRDFGKGRVRRCAGLAAWATAKIHCRRAAFNSQTGSLEPKPCNRNIVFLWHGYG